MVGKNGRMVAVLAVMLMATLLVGCSATTDTEGDTVVFGGSRVIQSGEVVAGNLVVFGGNVEVEEGATVQGDVAVMGGSVQVDGMVGGAVAVMGGSLETGATSNVQGSVVTMGGDVTRADVGDSIPEMPEAPELPDTPDTPDMTEIPVVPDIPDMPEMAEYQEQGLFERAIGGVFGIVGKLMQAIAFGALGLVITMFLPEHVRRIGTAAENAPAASVGVGFLASLAFMALLGIAIIASFLLIGIPFVVLLPIVTGAAWAMGFIGIGFLFGTRLLKTADIRSPRAPAAAAIGTGTLVLIGNLIGWIPLIGWLFTPVLGFWALGATVLTRGGTQPYPAPRIAHRATSPIGGTGAASERPVSPRSSASSSGNLFADLANDLGLDEDDLKNDK